MIALTLTGLLISTYPSRVQSYWSLKSSPLASRVGPYLQQRRIRDASSGLGKKKKERKQTTQGLGKERKKTDKPHEGWGEDRVPTCTSRILEGWEAARRARMRVFLF